MNPCPCGYFNVANRVCSCARYRVAEYHARVSGPLLDRIDITLETRAVELKHITRLDGDEPTSEQYRARVESARERQRHRFRAENGVFCNAQMGPRALKRFCQMSDEAKAALERAVALHGFSARAHDRILKLARTRADLEGHGGIETIDMHFAIGCRMIDRRNWIQTPDYSPRRTDTG
jgi:magnesium chelatase family protein